MRPTGRGRRKVFDFVGLDDEEAVWLAPVGGDLGEELVGGDAGGGGEVEFVADLLADGAGNAGGGGEAGLVFGDVEVGFVEGERFDEIGVALEDLAGDARDGAVTGEVGRDEDCLRAETLGGDGGHGGANAEDAGFIGCGADDGAVAAPGDDDRFAAQLWVVPLFDGGVEGVHVDVNDLAGGHLGTWYAICEWLLGDAEADEGDYSPGVSAVRGDESCGCGVGGELCAGGGEDVGDEAEVAVVAEAVGGDVADGGFGEVGWERRAGWEEKFVGAAGVFDARPDVVAGVELEEGFEEVAVFDAVVG